MKDKEVSAYTLREKHCFDTRTIRHLEANEYTTTDTLNNLCKILNCKLEDIAEYKPDE